MSFYFNLQDTKPTEFREENGFVIIPTVFTKEGVHNRGLKPYSEIKANIKTLEGKPIVWGHPSPPRPVDPKRDNIIGICRNVQARDDMRDGHGEAWIDTSKVDANWLQDLRLRKASARAGSVGRHDVSDFVSGTFKGIPYDRIDRNFRFDHYAIGLPVGACPVEDGCGLAFDEVIPLLNPIDINGKKFVPLENALSYARDRILGRINAPYEMSPIETKWIDTDEYLGSYTPEAKLHASAIIKEGEPIALHHQLCGKLNLNGIREASKLILENFYDLTPEEAESAKSHMVKHYHEYNQKAPWEMKVDMATEPKADEKIIRENEQLKIKVQGYETEINTLKTSVTKLTSDFDDLKPRLDKLKAIEAQEADADKKKSVEILTEIATARNVKITPELLKEYEGWSVEQLETLKAMSIPAGKPANTLDRSLFAPPTIVTEGTPDGVRPFLVIDPTPEDHLKQAKRTLPDVYEERLKRQMTKS